MPKNRRKELELRLKQNRGFDIVGQWSRSLRETCGVEISPSSFLSIQATEELKKAFFEKVKNDPNARRQWWSKNEIELLQNHLLDPCIDSGSRPMILFSSVDPLIGALRVPAGLVLKSAMAVWEIVEEDLCLASDDLRDGFCLEQNFYTPSGDYVKEGVFELTSWGVFAGKTE